MCALYLRLTLELKYTNIILPLCSVHSIINSCFTVLCNVVGWGGVGVDYRTETGSKSGQNSCLDK